MQLVARPADLHAQTGVRVVLSKPRLALGAIVLAAQALVVEGLFTSRA